VLLLGALLPGSVYVLLQTVNFRAN